MIIHPSPPDNPSLANWRHHSGPELGLRRSEHGSGISNFGTSNNTNQSRRVPIPWKVCLFRWHLSGAQPALLMFAQPQRALFAATPLYRYLCLLFQAFASKQTTTIGGGAPKFRGFVSSLGRLFASAHCRFGFLFSLSMNSLLIHVHNCRRRSYFLFPEIIALLPPQTPRIWAR